MPEFQKWVHEHIKYPEGVTSEGRVDVSFRITEDGEIADVKVLRGADAKLNEEAIRVIESSSNGWVPAMATEGRAQASSLYTLFYYGGSSALGYAVGIAFTGAGWGGAALCIGALIVIAIVLAAIFLPRRPVVPSGN